MSHPRRPQSGRSLEELHPDLATEWVTSDDQVSPRDVSAGSAFVATWRCKQGHQWTSPVYSRTRGYGCPTCGYEAMAAYRSQADDGQSLRDRYPAVAAEWDETANGIKAEDVPASSRTKAHWICSTCAHRWQAVVDNRTRLGRGCPACARATRSASKAEPVGDRSLAALRPEIAGEWDPLHPLNEGASPSTVANRSRTRRGWCCSSCGTKFEASPDNRRGPGCRSCRYRRTVAARAE